MNFYINIIIALAFLAKKANFWLLRAAAWVKKKRSYDYYGNDSQRENEIVFWLARSQLINAKRLIFASLA